MKKYNEKWFIDKIKQLEKSLALGYESTLDFNYGCIRGWLCAGIISRKFYRELIDNFATYFGDYDDEDENEIELAEKYGRIISHRTNYMNKITKKEILADRKMAEEKTKEEE